MRAREEEDFEAMSTTITSVYDLRGIGVSAVYVSRKIWDWMQGQHRQSMNPKRNLISLAVYTDTAQSYDSANVEFHNTKTGALAATMKPYGADRRIPVKVKYSGSNPWKIVVGYRKESAQ